MSNASHKYGLTILGAGGHGRVVADIAGLCGYAEIEFVDHSFPERQSTLAWPIVGREFGAGRAGFDRFVAIGDNRTRMQHIEELIGAGKEPPTLIHPSAAVSRFASLGAGTVVMPAAIVNAGAHVGRGVIINSGASIDHDCIVADGVHVSPGAHVAGGVSIGRCSWIGIGAAIKECVKVGSHAVVGAGAAVVSDVPDNARALGVPARWRQD